jgi:hypothetical protein
MGTWQQMHPPKAYLAGRPVWSRRASPDARRVARRGLVCQGRQRQERVRSAGFLSIPVLARLLAAGSQPGTGRENSKQQLQVWTGRHRQRRRVPRLLHSDLAGADGGSCRYIFFGWGQSVPFGTAVALMGSWMQRDARCLGLRPLLGERGSRLREQTRGMRPAQRRGDSGHGGGSAPDVKVLVPEQPCLHTPALAGAQRLRRRLHLVARPVLAHAALAPCPGLPSTAVGPRRRFARRSRGGRRPWCRLAVGIHSPFSREQRVCCAIQVAIRYASYVFQIIEQNIPEDLRQRLLATRTNGAAWQDNSALSKKGTPI